MLLSNNDLADYIRKPQNNTKTWQCWARRHALAHTHTSVDVLHNPKSQRKWGELHKKMWQLTSWLINCFGLQESLKYSWRQQVESQQTTVPEKDVFVFPPGLHPEWSQPYTYIHIIHIHRSLLQIFAIACDSYAYGLNWPLISNSLLGPVCNISTTITRIASNFCADIHGSKEIKLFCTVAPLTLQISHVRWCRGGTYINCWENIH